MCLISYCQSVRQLMNESLSESLLQSVGQCPLTFLYLFSSSPLLPYSPPPSPLPPSPSPPLPLLSSSSSLLSSPTLLSSYSHLPPTLPFPSILLIPSPSFLLLSSFPLPLLSSSPLDSLSYFMRLLIHIDWGMFRHLMQLMNYHKAYICPPYELTVTAIACQLPIIGVNYHWLYLMNDMGPYISSYCFYEYSTVCVIKLNTKYDGIKFSREYFFLLKTVWDLQDSDCAMNILFNFNPVLFFFLALWIAYICQYIFRL